MRHLTEVIRDPIQVYFTQILTKALLEYLSKKADAQLFPRFQIVCVHLEMQTSKLIKLLVRRSAAIDKQNLVSFNQLNEEI